MKGHSKEQANNLFLFLLLITPFIFNINQNPKAMNITKTSSYSGIVRTIDLNVTLEQLQNWQNGMLIYKAMPNLTADEREFIISGVTNEEWEEMFPPEPEENVPDLEYPQ